MAELAIPHCPEDSLSSSPDSEGHVSPNSSTHPASASSFVYETCEKLGYAASVAWLPATILGCSFASAPDAGLLAQFIPQLAVITPIAPMLACLIACALFGLVITLISDRVTNASAFHGMWVVALCATLATLAISFVYVRAVLLALSFSIVRVLWKIHLVNKSFDSSTLLIATGFCGVYLIGSSQFGPNAQAVAPCMLLLVSLALFLGVLPSTFKDWVAVPKEATRHNFTISQKLFVAASKTATGFVFGGMIVLLSVGWSLIIAGLAWIAAALGGFLYGKRKTASKSTLRGLYMIGTTICLVILPVAPSWLSGLCAGALVGLSVLNAVTSAQRRVIIKKDPTLSDLWLAGYRHATNKVGLGIGLAVGYLAFTFSGQNPALLYGASGAMVVIVVVASLLSLGIFTEKRQRTSLGAIEDPWKEKVGVIAREYQLNERQTDILEMLSRGRNAKYIANRLYLSEGTIKKSIFQIYKILDVHTQQDLITLVMDVDLRPKPMAD